MCKSVTFLILILVLASCSVAIFPAKATPMTIVVPDDYPTITEAVSEAAEGDLVFVKRGIHQEQTLIINKTVFLKGESAKDTIIIFHPPLIFTGYHSVVPVYTYDKSMKIHASGVELQGFTIFSEKTTEAPPDLANHVLGRTDPPFVAMGGAEILSTGNNTRIAGNTLNTGLLIEGFNSTIAENMLASGAKCYGSDNKFVSNIVTGSGIEVGGFNNQVYANTITGGYKIHSGILSTGNGNVIAQNNVTNCNGGLVIYRTYNSESSHNIFYANRLTKNVYGIDITAGSNNTFYANELVNNTVGAKVGYEKLPETTAVFYHNNFLGSIEQVSRSTSVNYIPGVWSEPFNVKGSFDTGKEGNYWSDYSGLDENDDGLGDTPYVIDANRRDDYPLMEPYDISKANLILPVGLSQPEPFPTVIVVTALSVSAGLAILSIIIYLKKRDSKRTTI